MAIVIFAASASAAPALDTVAGYTATPYLSLPQETLMEGFDMDSSGNVYYIETAYQYIGDPVYWYMPTASSLKRYNASAGTTDTLYDFSSGVYGSFVRLQGDTVYFGNSSDGAIRSIGTAGGTATDIINMAGQYDMKFDGSGEMFVSAKPGSDSTIYHVFDDGLGYVADPIAETGGYSGPIEFDDQDNLYYGLPNFGAGEVVTFTAAEIAAAVAAENTGVAELGSADWDSYCAGLSACGYLQFDGDGNLLSSSWEGVVDMIDGLNSHDSFMSSPNGTSPGMMAWVSDMDSLFVTGTDYAIGEYSGTLFQVTAVPEPASILMALGGLVAGAGIVRRRLRLKK